MKKRGTAGLLGGALAVVLLAGNVLGGSYPAYAQDTQYHDGNYTASAHVEFHEVVNYDLYVTVSVKDGVISKVALNDEKNADIEAVNVPYINYAMKGMADSYIGTTGTAADTVSGATYSANAINEAVAKAMVKSQSNEADADTADTPSGDNGQNDNQNGSDNTNDTQKPSDDKTNSGDTGNDSYERVLKTGAYELTADSYDASAMMKMPAFICIDAENNTFSVHPYKNGIVDYATNKGSGSISFDSATGVYTMTYEAGVTVVALGATTTFTADADSITFTSPLRYGAAQMNTTDADGKFLSYTAKTSAYEGTLTSGAYVLTADSYDASAMMKMPAYIGIDMGKKTFIVHPYKNDMVDNDTNKGSGSISFDSATGVYTMTYEAGVTVVALGATTTFTADADSITFTSPLRYGAAQMNTTDADGNFLSYTAVPYTQEIPDGDTNDDTQGKGDSGNTSGGTSNDSTQSGESTGNSASESSANASEQDSGSTQSGAQTSGNSTVETGDAAMTGIYAVSAVVSIGLLIAAAVLKKRKRVL